MQCMKELIKWMQNNKEWLFDGVGAGIIVAIGGCLRRRLFKHKEKQQDGIHDEVNIQGQEKEKKVESWFSKRFFKMLHLINDAKNWNEKEYTIEYVSSLIGLTNAEQLKQYVNGVVEPEEYIKQSFVDVFGVNREWMLYGQGEYPFSSNINFYGNNPMDILRNENLEKIKSFIIVIGLYEKKRHACVIRKKSEYCYEVYPSKFILYSDVGETGRDNLVEFYRFVREAERIKKLEYSVYEATEQQFLELTNGSIAPKMARKFKVAKFFIDKFLDLSSDSIEQDEIFWDDDLVEVQKKIKSELPLRDEIDQKNDEKIIEKNLGRHFDEKTIERADDIDNYDTSTTFFDYRFGKAFPGVRGLEEFDNSEECVDRLEILLRAPLGKEKLASPIWWFRGSSNLQIHNFLRLSRSKFLMNCEEIEVNRIVVYGASEYYKKFVYVEANPEKSVGLYDITEDFIEEWKNKYGEYHEEYALYDGIAITRAEYDDDAAVINGKVVDLENKAHLRVRYLTSYNFIICAQFNPINNTKIDGQMKRLLDGILEGTHKVDDIVELVERLGRHRNDM